MLLMVEKSIWSGICHAIYRYVKTNNKHMKNYHKSTISLHLMHLDANNLFGWPMSQKHHVNGFKLVQKLSKFDESLIKSYDEDSDQGYFPEVDVEYSEKLFNLHSDLPFLFEMNKVKKCNELVYSIYDKENYVVHIRALKQALNHGLMLK